jgi:integrase
MPRPKTGTIYRHGDHWDVRLTLPDGSRSPPIHLPQGFSEAKARDRAASLAQLAAKEALPRSKGKGHAMAATDPLASWAERWCAAREERGLTSVDDDRGRLRKWVLPKLGDKPIAEITRTDIEQLVEALDSSVRAGALSWKTAKNVWGVVSKMFDDACRSKVLALRVLEQNPTTGVRGPDEGVKKSKSYIFPTEFLALVMCERVPIRWRQLFALSVYTYTRAAELEALEWEDVDIDRRIIHIHRAIDRSENGEVKETKTNNPRRIPIEPALLPLLLALQGTASRGRLISMPPACDLSDRLRQYLRWAGVTRAELFANDATRKQITFHDLRATGITWMALRGEEPIKIMRRAGHENIATTMGYVREAENLVHAVGDPFPPLPPALLVSSAESSEGPAYWAQLRESTYKIVASPAGFGTLGHPPTRPSPPDFADLQPLPMGFAA